MEIKRESGGFISGFADSEYAAKWLIWRFIGSKRKR
jgi:hypothetical protein